MVRIGGLIAALAYLSVAVTALSEDFDAELFVAPLGAGANIKSANLCPTNVDGMCPQFDLWTVGNDDFPDTVRIELHPSTRSECSHGYSVDINHSSSRDARGQDLVMLNYSVTAATIEPGTWTGRFWSIVLSGMENCTDLRVTVSGASKTPHRFPR